ncbi:MAG: hypothetical protein WDN69_26405 [Aliidongia sp.]
MMSATPVALLHAIRSQRGGDRQGGTGEGFVADPLLLMDQKNLLAMGAAGQEQLAHGRRRILPDAGGDAADLAVFHFEWGTGCGQHGMRLGDRHGRPGFGRRLRTHRR